MMASMNKKKTEEVDEAWGYTIDPASIKTPRDNQGETEENSSRKASSQRKEAPKRYD